MSSEWKVLTIVGLFVEQGNENGELGERMYNKNENNMKPLYSLKLVF